MVLVVLLISGLANRLYDLTDPPFDFHPTRQFRSAIIARGIYYQWSPYVDETVRGSAVAFKSSMALYEPPLLESIVALTYLLVGEEHLWIARLYSSFFWVFGGLVLYSLAQRMTNREGGLSITPIGTLLMSRMKKEAFQWRLLFIVACLVILVYFLGTARGILSSQDYRNEPAYWQEVASALPKNSKVVALTQNYDYPLMYYGWRKVTL